MELEIQTPAAISVPAASSRCGYEKCKYHQITSVDAAANTGSGSLCNNNKLKRCSRCKSRWYCSVGCQKADFPSHRKECRRICEKDSEARGSSKPKSFGGDDNERQQQLKEQQQQQQYQVEEREGKGRCLIAARAIRPKERIRPPSPSSIGTATEAVAADATEKSNEDTDYWTPFVPPVLNEDRRRTCCALCFRHLDCHDLSQQQRQQLHSISGSNPLYPFNFCSQHCKYQATKVGLYDEDLAIRRLQGLMPPRIFSTAILVYRIVRRLHDPKVREQIDDLQSKPPPGPYFETTTSENIIKVDHENDVDVNNAQAYHTQAVIATVMKMLQCTSLSSSCTRVPDTMLSVERLTDIIWKIRLNGFSICDGESVPYGVGLFRLPASFMNHSCGNSGGDSSTKRKGAKTNVIQTFCFREGCMPCLCLTAFGNDDIQPGDEICISYTDTMCPSHLRQLQLQRNYYFHCTCDACADHVETEDAWRMGMKCSQCQDGIGRRVGITRTIPTLVSSYKCSKCNNTNFSNVLKLIKAFDDEHEKHDRNEKSINCGRHLNTERSQLQKKYDDLKVVCAYDSWYVQEAGEELLRHILDEFSCTQVEDERQRIGFDALALIEELLSTAVGSEAADQQKYCCTSYFLRRYQLLYKGAKLRLFLVPDPRRSIHELQDVMTALSPCYHDDHDFINGLKECLRCAMR